ncbi:MAG: histone deacetylase [Terriglobia bacterium]
MLEFSAMLPFKLAYSDGYDLNLGDHVFPARKYKLIREKCLAEGVAAREDFLEPEPAADADILRVHTQEWTRKLKQGKLNYFELLRLEVPYSPQLVRAFWLSAGGSTLAARRALADRCAFNLGGGFHHAFPDHGEGFCAINDVAVAVRCLQADKAIETALVVDLDVHQGNGTAAIFAGDASVYTLSMHQENNYPYPKPPSDLDVHLPDGIADADYLKLLRQAFDKAFSDFHQQWERDPELIFYLAGADPYCEDQLGGLGLTIAGLGARDRMVLEAARDRRIPIAVTFAGGYARNTDDTVQIHINTILAARQTFTEDTAGTEM